ncbi:unnamed protein product [Discosporangium mesarthrocarpum]
MAYATSKGLLYPTLLLSNFRVKRENLPPNFQLPPSVDEALAKTFPPVRELTSELQVLQRIGNEREAEEEARKKAGAAIAKEEARLKTEIAEADQALAHEEGKGPTPSDKKKMVLQLKSIMQSTENEAEQLLERSEWNLPRAVQMFLDNTM